MYASVEMINWNRRILDMHMQRLDIISSSCFNSFQIIQAISFQPRYIFFGFKFLIPVGLVFGKVPVLLKAAKQKKMVSYTYLLFLLGGGYFQRQMRGVEQRNANGEDKLPASHLSSFAFDLSYKFTMNVTNYYT